MKKIITGLMILALLISLSYQGKAISEDNINKGEFIKTMIDLKGGPLADDSLPETPTFSDVLTGSQYFSYVETAYILKLIEKNSSFFEPLGNIKKDEAVKIFVKTLGIPTNTSNGPHFKDVPENWWTYEQIESLYHRGVITLGNGYFYPKNDLTNSELTEWIEREEGTYHGEDKPDITVDSIEIEKRTSNGKQYYYYEIYITNVGNASAKKSNTNVEFFPYQPVSIDGKNSYECLSELNKTIPGNYLITEDSLEPGERELITGYFNPVVSGDLSISVTVDTENELEEENESNNKFTKTFLVTKIIEKMYCPELCTNKYCSNQEKRPDLTIDRIEFKKNSVNSGQLAYNFSVYVKNIGNSEAEKANLKVELLPSQPKKIILDNNDFEYQCYNEAESTVPNGYLVKEDVLPVGEEEVYTNYFNPIQPGEITIKATIDEEENIDESNEFNNTLSATFTVKDLVDSSFCPNLCHDNQCGSVNKTATDLVLDSINSTKTGENEYKIDLTSCMEGAESIDDLYENGQSSRELEYQYTTYDQNNLEYTVSASSGKSGFKDGECENISFYVKDNAGERISQNAKIKINLDPNNKITEKDETNNSELHLVSIGCTPEGQIMDIGGNCCTGLIMSSTEWSERSQTCSENKFKRCIKCGDGICNTGEDICNCPDDCEEVEIVRNEDNEDSNENNAEENNKIFADIDETTIEGKASLNLYEKGIIGGYPDGEFKGENAVNRAEAAKFILLARDGEISEESDNPDRFPDVSSGQWFHKYVMTCELEGIIEGYPDGFFRPQDTVNTVEFLKMLAIAFDLELGLDYSYEDVQKIDWFSDYAGIAEKYTLFPDRITLLEPDKELTRNEVAVAIYQLLKAVD